MVVLRINVNAALCVWFKIYETNIKLDRLHKLA